VAATGRTLSGAVSVAVLWSRRRRSSIPPTAARDAGGGTAEGVPVTTPRDESSGDYGYDLVHEDLRRSRASGESDPAAADDPGPAESGGDYGYDEAHGF
jgi:hypothetical protein